MTHDQDSPTELDDRAAAAPATAAAVAPAGRLAWLRGHRRWLYALAVVALLAQMAFAMVTTAVAQTPTIDEPVYAGTAVVYQQQGSLRYNPEHPPLGKLLIGVGLAFADPRLDPGFTGSQGGLGRHLLYEAGNDPEQLMLLARLPMIVLTLLFGLVVFGFARELVGSGGGLVALALYAFSPNLIAHGSLATLDVATAGFLLTSVWLLWRARCHSLGYLPAAGLALGAAVATKMTALAAVPVLLPLAAWSVWYAARNRPAPSAIMNKLARPAGASSSPPSLPGVVARARTAANLSAAASAVRQFAHDRRGLAVVAVAAAGGLAVLAVAVVWASYLIVDPQLQWTPPAEVPVVDGLRGLLVDSLPFPEPFRDGMRIQFGFEEAGFGGYLFGEAYDGSRWYYLPAALLVKTPLGALALWLAGAAAMLAVPRLRPAAAYLLLPAGVLLAAAMTSDRDLGVRYAIFLPMFLAVAAAAVVAVRWQWLRLAAAALVLLVAVSSLRTFPYYLPYANEAFGGPSQTYQHLHDSNVDWGQDLARLADRLRERYPDEQVWLAYKGSGVPAHYGIQAADPFQAPAEQVRGLLVVSNSWVATAQGHLRALIDTSEPIDQVGHSITIYRR